eukprot:366264-Chlamydomonas_euryale.AAC.7
MPGRLHNRCKLPGSHSYTAGERHNRLTSFSQRIQPSRLFPGETAVEGFSQRMQPSRLFPGETAAEGFSQRIQPSRLSPEDIAVQGFSQRIQPSRLFPGETAVEGFSQGIQPSRLFPGETAVEGFSQRIQPLKTIPSRLHSCQSMHPQDRSCRAAPTELQSCTTRVRAAPTESEPHHRVGATPTESEPHPQSQSCPYRVRARGSGRNDQPDAPTPTRVAARCVAYG